MSDPCPGLRVRMYARKSGGPYAKMPQQKSTIGAHAVDYTIKATPGVNFGLIVKVKEDFDFKGSEGLCITITITDDCRVGNGAAAAPFRLEQSWYVDALSKWSGRQTFHKFDKVVTSDGSLARDLEFTVPFSIEPYLLARYSAESCITVCVERGNLLEGALASHAYRKTDPELHRHYQRRISKEQIEPKQFKTLEGIEGLVAIYYFHNVDATDTAIQGAADISARPLEWAHGANATPATVARLKFNIETTQGSHGLTVIDAGRGLTQPAINDKFASKIVPRPYHIEKNSSEILKLQRSMDALIAAMEGVEAEPRVTVRQDGREDPFFVEKQDTKFALSRRAQKVMANLYEDVYSRSPPAKDACILTQQPVADDVSEIKGDDTPRELKKRSLMVRLKLNGRDGKRATEASCPRSEHRAPEQEVVGTANKKIADSIAEPGEIIPKRSQKPNLTFHRRVTKVGDRVQFVDTRMFEKQETSAAKTSVLLPNLTSTNARKVPSRTIAEKMPQLASEQHGQTKANHANSGRDDPKPKTVGSRDKKKNGKEKTEQSRRIEKEVEVFDGDHWITDFEDHNKEDADYVLVDEPTPAGPAANGCVCS